MSLFLLLTLKNLCYTGRLTAFSRRGRAQWWGTRLRPPPRTPVGSPRSPPLQFLIQPLDIFFLDNLKIALCIVM